MTHDNERQIQERLYEVLERRAYAKNDPLGYHVNLETFEILLKYGFLESENNRTVDNCYIHRLVSYRGTIFKTITEEEIDFKVEEIDSEY